MLNQITPMLPYSSGVAPQTVDAPAELRILCRPDVRVNVPLEDQTNDRCTRGTIRVDFSIKIIEDPEKTNMSSDFRLKTRERLIEQITKIDYSGSTNVNPRKEDVSTEPDTDWFSIAQQNMTESPIIASVQFVEPEIAEQIVKAPHLLSFFDHQTFRGVIEDSHTELIGALTNSDTPGERLTIKASPLARHTVLHDHLTGVAQKLLRDAYNRYQQARNSNIDKIIKEYS